MLAAGRAPLRPGGALGGTALSVELTVEPFDAPAAVTLVERVQADLAQRYGGGDPTVLTPAAMAPPAGLFLVARLDGVPVACGGYRFSAPGMAEIKRMYVEPAVRGRGIARLLLAELEQRAAAAGYGIVRLETGLRQPEAMALYESEGYRPVAPYAGHDDWPLSRCYAREVTSVPPPDHGVRNLA